MNIMTRNLAGSAPPQDCHKRTTVRYFSAALRRLHAVWKSAGRKPAYELHLTTGHTLRHCEMMLAGDRAGGGAVFVDLILGTDQGPETISEWIKVREAAGLPVASWAYDLAALAAVSAAMRAQELNRRQAEDLRKLNHKTKTSTG